MEPVFVLLTIILAFSSLTITFRAMYLILTREFNGSRLRWFLIVMIAFIGPIVWLIKGRKLVGNKVEQ